MQCEVFFQAFAGGNFIYSGVYDNIISISHDLDPESCFKINYYYPNFAQILLQESKLNEHNIFEWFGKFNHFQLFIWSGFQSFE